MPEVSIFLSDDLFGFEKGEWAIRAEGGVIRSIKKLSDRKPDVPAGAAVHDLRGKTVLPGLIDSHVHLIGTAVQMITPSVRGIATLEELDRAILDSKPEKGRLNKFLGLDLSAFPDRAAVNAKHLDSLVGDIPLMLKSIEGHSALFNSAGLAMMPVRAGTEGVELDKDGKVTGVVRDAAYENLVDSVHDTVTDEEKLRGMDIAIARAAERGCAGIHCLEGYGHNRRREFELMLEYAKTCPLDLTLYPRTLDFDLVCELGLPRIGGCELIDGAIGSFTAALNEPYAVFPGKGTLFKSDMDVRDFFARAFSRNLQPCVHVIGDRGIDQCLSVLESLASEYKIEKHRPRLDHFIVARDDQIARAARLGICAGVQPAFMAAWGARGGKYEWALGAKRWELLHRYGSMVKKGMHISAGSDSYITPIDPPAALAAMIHHPNERERVDFETAVRLHTESCAFLAKEEKTKGKIAAGYDATFTVLESIEPIIENAPGEAKIAGVWVRGKYVQD
ncbi:MAG: amidohydrolase family protein [bacterium]|jgi:hypothetical protein